MTVSIFSNYGDLMFKYVSAFFLFFSTDLLCIHLSQIHLCTICFTWTLPGGLYSSTLCRPCLISVLGHEIGFLHLFFFLVLRRHTHSIPEAKWLPFEVDLPSCKQVGRCSGLYGNEKASSGLVVFFYAPLYSGFFCLLIFVLYITQFFWPIL